MTTRTFAIIGMSCGHCVMAVEKALSKLENVTVKNVEIGSATVEFLPESVDEATIVAAIEDAGYSVAASTTAHTH